MADKINTTGNLAAGTPPVDHNQAAGMYLRDLASQKEGVVDPSTGKPIPPQPPVLKRDHPPVSTVRENVPNVDAGRPRPDQGVPEENPSAIVKAVEGSADAERLINNARANAEATETPPVPVDNDTDPNVVDQRGAPSGTMLTPEEAAALPKGDIDESAREEAEDKPFPAEDAGIITEDENFDDNRGPNEVNMRPKGPRYD